MQQLKIIRESRYQDSDILGLSLARLSLGDNGCEIGTASKIDSITRN